MICRGRNVIHTNKKEQKISNVYWNQKGTISRKEQFGASIEQKPTWVPLFKCIFGAFQAKQIFHDFVHPTFGCIKCSDQGLVLFCNFFVNLLYHSTLKKTLILWPLFMDGVQLPQGKSHFEVAVYFLPLISQKFLRLIFSTSEG